MKFTYGMTGLVLGLMLGFGGYVTSVRVRAASIQSGVSAPPCSDEFVPDVMAPPQITQAAGIR